jgi:MFS superfamily sulfate permease-like transporter
VSIHYAVVLYTLISYLAGLEDLGVKVVGTVPTGLPSPSVPTLGPYSFSEVFMRSIGIVIVTFVISISIVKVFSARFGYRVDANQELLAMGAANLVGGFFSCYPSAFSLSISLFKTEIR